MKKVQAEPEAESTELRWVASGKTILNNKGKPVKQYEPYFSPNQHRFEEPAEIGVTPLMYYDAPGRLIRTELPDGSFSKVEFTPWHVLTYDPNDTAFDSDSAKRSDWYKRRKDPTHPRFGEFNSAQNARAAELVEMHANTPSAMFLDSLGREVISVGHNRFKDSQEMAHDDKYVTFTKLDAEGKPLWIRDARKNLVMQYITPPVPSNQVGDPQTGFVPCYNIAGNLLFQHSMDAGDRWMLNDAVGKPMYGWDSRGHVIETKYDQLRRPTEVFVSGGDDIPAGQPVLAENIVYGESQGSTNNHRGAIFQHFDGAGVVTNTEYDFKGNLIETSRRLVKQYKKQIDWKQPPENDEIFTARTEFDALNRPILVISPHNGDIIRSEIRPIYNEANLLNEVRVKIRGAAEEAYVKNIDYNAKGQRELIKYGNDATTTYDYDPDTFRLTHLKTSRQSDNAQLQDLFYTYDPVGNITHIEDLAQQTIYFNSQVVLPTNDYTYDAIYRLIEATGREHIGQTSNNLPEHRPELKPHYDFNDSTRMRLAHPHDGQKMRPYTERYEYDAVGNFERFIHQANGGSWTRRYQYEAGNNRLRSTTLPGDPADGSLPQRYLHDSHGNMTRMPHLAQMNWDFEDQLQMVDLGGGGQAYYVYDAAGQRTRKVWEKSPSLTEERLYLGGFEIFRRRDGSRTITLEHETLQIMDERKCIALVETKTVDSDLPLGPNTSVIRYQFGSHLGSASLELDETGAVISYEEYHPYGTASYQAGRSVAEVSLKRYRYTGKEQDDETGLYYHGARYYAPWLARWTVTDPAGLIDGPGLYTYVRGNPIRLSDPNGRQGFSEEQQRTAEAAAKMLAGVGEGGAEFMYGPRQARQMRRLTPADQRVAAPAVREYGSGKVGGDTPSDPLESETEHLHPWGGFYYLEGALEVFALPTEPQYKSLSDLPEALGQAALASNPAIAVTYGFVSSVYSAVTEQDEDEQKRAVGRVGGHILAAALGRLAARRAPAPKSVEGAPGAPSARVLAEQLAETLAQQGKGRSLQHSPIEVLVVEDAPPTAATPNRSVYNALKKSGVAEQLGIELLEPSPKRLYLVSGGETVYPARPVTVHGGDILRMNLIQKRGAAAAQAVGETYSKGVAICPECQSGWDVLPRIRQLNPK